MSPHGMSQWLPKAMDTSSALPSPFLNMQIQAWYGSIWVLSQKKSIIKSISKCLMITRRQNSFWSISLMFTEILLLLSAMSSLSNSIKVKPRPSWLIWKEFSGLQDRYKHPHIVLTRFSIQCSCSLQTLQLGEGDWSGLTKNRIEESNKNLVQST